MSPSTKKAQRDNLHKTLDSIANDLRGKVDGWDFKAYVLGTLFYRYLCDHLVHIIMGLPANRGHVVELPSG